MELDSNLDGITDQVASDTNGDGVTDMWQIDTNSDGLVDQNAFDTDGDGVADNWNLDSNEDGISDGAAFDLDRNGSIDELNIDANQDGLPESQSFDTDSDGFYDTSVTQASVTPVDPDPLGLNSESEFPMPALDALEDMANSPGVVVPRTDAVGPIESIVFDPHAPTGLAAPTTGITTTGDSS